MDTLIKSLVQANFAPERIIPRAPMARFTTFRVGGPADVLVNIDSAAEISVALRAAIIFGSTEPGTKTVISREYSAEWKRGDEPYYPVNDEKNSCLYEQYKALAEAEPGVLFGGRLGEYKYYDMDKVIETALQRVRAVIA